MKKTILLISASILLLTACSEKTKTAKSKFIKDAISAYKSDKTVNIITKTLEAKNYKVVSIFDHEKEASQLKEMLYPTKTIEFNNPKISTTLIQCNPTMALELPIRMSISNEINGKAHVTYTDPEYWSLKHNIKDKKCIDLLFLIKKDLSNAVSKIENNKK